MHPILFKLGPIIIHTYGLMMATAFLVSYLLLAREVRRLGEKTDFASNMVFWAAVGGLAGAKLLYALENLKYTIQDPLGTIFSGAGLAFHGGLFGGTLAVIVYLKKHKKSVGEYADIVGPILLVGQAIGRIGCFFAGCCHGKECSLPWAVTFPNAIPPASGPVHPTQLYEALYNVIIYFVLIKLRPRLRKRWATFSLYLIFAGVERFLIEFIRVNPRILFGLTVFQYTSLAMILAGIFILLFLAEPLDKKGYNR
ncbi:MAG: prolipoprotein diacylglyceryl transferase [Candidatus Neomarinimicrobiota bacterium]|nr:MAG: prolipoprotein diacylglyceryl transferase [Candidatus Neomarinimicrobiota bacterium]